MWISFYFILSTIESFVLFIFTAFEQSNLQEQVFLSYSLERLILLAILFFTIIIFSYLTYHSFSRKTKIGQILTDALSNEKLLWPLMWGNILLATLIYFLFVQPSEWFGEYLDVFLRLRPLLFWLLVLSLQTLFFMFNWYCVNFTGKSGNVTSKIEIRELNLVFAIFILSLVVKLIFVIPNGYGLLKDVGESKYFNMIYYLYKGIFLDSLDDVTSHYPFLYPLTLVFTYFIKNHAFKCMLLINSIYASSIIFPLYLISRRLLDQKLSLILIIISSLIPFQFLLPIRLLSENLYFPLLLWSIYLVFAAPENPRYRFLWDCLTGLALGLLYLTRYMTLAVIPFLLLAWWVKPFDGVSGIFQLNLKKVGHALVIGLIAALTFSPWVMVGMNNGLSLWQTLGFGIAAQTNPQQLTLGNLILWIGFYADYYVLLAAPFLNLIFIAFHGFNLKDLKDERNRWLFVLLMLMIAFGLAVVRHSWRAYYNLEEPERIMGRYVIYFVPLFLITGLTAIRNFDRKNYLSWKHFLGTTFILPFTLVLVSYLLIISGAIIPVDAQFINLLISIDGYYIKLLGISFFLFIILLYAGTSYLLWSGKKRIGEFVGVILLVFYLLGEPAYMDQMLSDATYQKLGYEVSEYILDLNKQAGHPQKYWIFIPSDMPKTPRLDIAWSLYVRNLESEWKFSKYSVELESELSGQIGIMVYPLDESNVVAAEDYQIQEINGEKFVIELIKN